MTDKKKQKKSSEHQQRTVAAPLSQGKVAQIDRTRQRQAVVAGQALAVFVAADTNFQNVWVSEDLH